jgi:hypothetical protein
MEWWRWSVVVGGVDEVVGWKRGRSENQMSGVVGVSCKYASTAASQTLTLKISRNGIRLLQ